MTVIQRRRNHRHSRKRQFRSQLAGKVQTGALFAAARTGTSGFRSDQSTSGTTITQQSKDGSSVVVDYTLGSRP